MRLIPAVATVLLVVGGDARVLTHSQALNDNGLMMRWAAVPQDSGMWLAMRVEAPLPEVGYLAVGFSPDDMMHNSEYVIGQHTGCVRLASNGETKGEPPNGVSSLRVVNTSFAVINGKAVLDFTRFSTGTNFDYRKTNSIIFAAGSKAPPTCDDPLTEAHHHDQHDYVGSAKVAFFAPSNVVAVSEEGGPCGAGDLHGVNDSPMRRCSEGLVCVLPGVCEKVKAKKDIPKAKKARMQIVLGIVIAGGIGLVALVFVHLRQGYRNRAAAARRYVEMDEEAGGTVDDEMAADEEGSKGEADPHQTEC